VLAWLARMLGALQQGGMLLAWLVRMLGGLQQGGMVLAWLLRTEDAWCSPTGRHGVGVVGEDAWCSPTVHRRRPRVPSVPLLYVCVCVDRFPMQVISLELLHRALVLIFCAVHCVPAWENSAILSFKVRSGNAFLNLDMLLVAYLLWKCPLSCLVATR